MHNPFIMDKLAAFQKDQRGDCLSFPFLQPQMSP